jgi:hypothetical protein
MLDGTKHITCFWHKFIENISKHGNWRVIFDPDSELGGKSDAIKIKTKTQSSQGM